MLFINNDEKRKIREEKLAASKLIHYKNKKEDLFCAKCGKKLD